MTEPQECNSMTITPWLAPPTRRPFTGNGKQLIVPGRNNRPTLIAIPTGSPLTVHVVDVDTGEETVVQTPCRDSTCYALEPGCDGCLYLGTSKNNMLKLDPQSCQADVIGTIPISKLTWSSGVSAGGRYICFGEAAGRGEIACFDVKQQEFVWHLTQTPPDALYCRRLAALPDGRIAAAWLAGPRSRLGLVDPVTGAYEVFDSPRLNGILVSELFVWRDFLVCCDPKQAGLVMFGLDDLGQCQTG